MDKDITEAKIYKKLAEIRGHTLSNLVGRMHGLFYMIDRYEEKREHEREPEKLEEIKNRSLEYVKEIWDTKNWKKKGIISPEDQAILTFCEDLIKEEK